MANFPSNNAAFPGTGVDSRSVFITRTYTHLVAGILGFILVELGTVRVRPRAADRALHARLQLDAHIWAPSC